MNKSLDRTNKKRIWNACMAFDDIFIESADKGRRSLCVGQRAKHNRGN